MLYCAHNVKEDVHAVIMAGSINEAGHIAADHWVVEYSDVVVISLEGWMKESGLSSIDIGE